MVKGTAKEPLHVSRCTVPHEILAYVTESQMATHKIFLKLQLFYSLHIVS